MLTLAVAVALVVKFVVLDGALIVSAVTRGRGWYCGGELGVCARDVRTCETIRRDGQRIMGSTSRRCAPQPEAWCFSYRMSNDGSLGAMCHRSREDCDHQRQLLADNTMLSTRNHSRCAVVGDLVAPAPDVGGAARTDAASLVVPDAVAVVAPVVAPAAAQPPPPAPVVAPAPAPQRLNPTTFSASSFISNGRNQYAPDRAFDGDPATTWTEDARGPGDGEWLQATFAGPQLVQRVRITTGWDHTSPRGEDLFTANSHLRRVRLVLGPNTSVVRNVGAEEREVIFDGLDAETATVRIEAVSVWPGARWADLCVGEVVIEGEPLANGPVAVPEANEDLRADGEGTRPCRYATRESFHLRASPTASRAGAVEITTNPVVELLHAERQRRGRERMFKVRLPDGREGWMFVPEAEVPPGCER